MFRSEAQGVPGATSSPGLCNNGAEPTRVKQWGTLGQMKLLSWLEQARPELTAANGWGDPQSYTNPGFSPSLTVETAASPGMPQWHPVGSLKQQISSPGLCVGFPRDTAVLQCILLGSFALSG